MSILSWIEDHISVAEKDVVAIVIKAKNDIELTAHEISAGLGWVASHTPDIASGLQRLEQILELVSIVDPAAKLEIAAVVATANVAMAGLNKFAAAYSAGNGDVSSVLAGYEAINAARAAVATATKLAVAAPSTPPPNAVPAAA